MKVLVTRDRAEFAKRTRDFLTRRPIEHNVLATVVATLEPNDCIDPPLFAWAEASGGGNVSGAVLRTPPRRLLASSMSMEVADALMPRLLEVDPELPGVNGPQPAASYLAEAWRRCAGGKVKPIMSQAIYWLARVNASARLAGGHARPASRADRELMIEWARAFNRELGVPDLDVDSSIERRLREGRLFVWDDDRVVSMVGTGPPVAGVVRLGPVYTPPEARRHGYATALVAEVSRRTLAAGATKCMLYTDLVNATSNSIYQAVGYERSTDAQEYLFSHDAPSE
ncbi:MAG: GNAT family N-acetyltransferase [Actinobacteria bacterium]|nr:GNAT family N-acetyltransferase [Actinomycetota bacterium]